MKKFLKIHPLMKIHDWMASNGLFAAGDGKSGIVYTMDEKILKNQTDKKILEYLEETALEYLDFIKISGKKLNMKYMRYMEEDLENHRILRRYYENPETVKLSKEMRNKKMEVDLEFFCHDRSNEVYDDDWHGNGLKSFDISKPIINPKFHKSDIQKKDG